MTRRRRALTAVWVLLCWIAPMACTLAVGLHLALEHGSGHDLEGLFLTAVHGHHHDLEVVPGHQHDWVRPGDLTVPKPPRVTLPGFVAAADSATGGLEMPGPAPANRSGPPASLFATHCSLLL